jgi:hypothetical protein
VTWWRAALLWGGLAWAAILALAAAAAILLAVGPDTWADALRRAAVVPALVHRAPVDTGPFVTRAALLLVTAGVGVVLFHGGRSVGSRAGGRPIPRTLLGSTVAVPYTLGSALISLAGPSPVPGSLIWPLVLGAACGGAGGLAAVLPGTGAERRARAILAGGWRASWVVVLGGTAGFLVVMALHPAIVRSYLDEAFRRGPATGALAVTGTALFLPNVGTGVASASMGGGIEFQALEASCAVVSYARIPRAAGTVRGPCGRLPFRLGSPASGYFVFLLLPAAAAAAGGWLATRRTKAAAARDGAVVGAAAGVAFAGLFAILSAAARISYQASGPAASFLGEVSVAVGPDPLAGFLVALAWGLAAGAAGGAMAGHLGTADEPG